MKIKGVLSNFYDYSPGLFLSLLVGLLGCTVKWTYSSGMADPLLIALVCGIIIRTFFPISTELKKGVLLAPKIFIPVGIVFYAAKNLNFVKFAQIDIKMIVLISAVITVYFTSILLLGKILKQKPQITYLSATGSAICGASAITITSQAVKADSDDISISLLAVAFSSFFALFIMLPFLATLLGMTNYTYGLFSGSVLQITGFVKEAAGNVPFLSETVAPAGLVKQALSIKALRYLGLLAAIPFLASLCKNKWNLPWSLWLFLTAGICGSIIFALNESFYNETIMPFIKPAYLILWSTAMAAVGLNADLRLLLSDNGAKALVMTFTGFIFACITFLVGINIIAFF